MIRPRTTPINTTCATRCPARRGRAGTAILPEPDGAGPGRWSRAGTPAGRDAAEGVNDDFLLSPVRGGPDKPQLQWHPQTPLLCTQGRGWVRGQTSRMARSQAPHLASPRVRGEELSRAVVHGFRHTWALLPAGRRLSFASIHSNRPIISCGGGGFASRSDAVQVTKIKAPSALSSVVRDPRTPPAPGVWSDDHHQHLHRRYRRRRGLFRASRRDAPPRRSTSAISLRSS